MKSKFTKFPLYLKLLLCTPLVLVAFAILGSIVIFIREPYENDSMPTSLSEKIVIQKIQDYPEDASAGDSCGGGTIQNYIKAYLHPNNKIERVKCQEFQLAFGDKIFFVDYESLIEGQKVVLSQNNWPLKEVVNLSGRYPGNKISDMKGDSEAVYFKFSGWHNPEKIVKLAIK